MCRIDFPIGTILSATGKTVRDLMFPNSQWKWNQVFYDPDTWGRLIHLQRFSGSKNMFLSLLFRGIIPVAEVIKWEVEIKSVKWSKKKYRNRWSEKRSEYFSLSFDPDLINSTFTEAQYLAQEFLLTAFWDWDHIGWDLQLTNVVQNNNKTKHYFYDFIVNMNHLEDFPPPIDDLPYEGYELYRDDVKWEFQKLIKTLNDKYSWVEWQNLFSSIYQKSWMPNNLYKDIKYFFYQQLNKLYDLFIQNETKTPTPSFPLASL